MYKPKSNNKDKSKPIVEEKLIKITNIDNDDISIVKLIKKLQPELADLVLDTTLSNILYYIDKGVSLAKIVFSFDIELSYIELSKTENALFSACYGKLEKILIDSKVTNMITNNSNSDNINMFAIKGYRPEFRDNFLPQIQGVSRILIEFSNGDQLNTEAGKISGNTPIDITEDNTNI